jgi:hypothetical protein
VVSGVDADLEAASVFEIRLSVFTPTRTAPRRKVAL